MKKLLNLLIVFGSVSFFMACTNSSPGMDTTVKDSTSSKMDGEETSFNMEAAKTLS